MCFSEASSNVFLKPVLSEITQRRADTFPLNILGGCRLLTCTAKICVLFGNLIQTGHLYSRCFNFPTHQSTTLSFVVCVLNLVCSSRAESRCSQRQQKVLNSALHRLTDNLKELQQENSILREELNTESPAGGLKGTFLNFTRSQTHFPSNNPSNKHTCCNKEWCTIEMLNPELSPRLQRVE